MDKAEGKRPEQSGRPPLQKVEWTKAAIEAALACMYSPKTTKTQKVNYINMRDALNAAWQEQHGIQK